MLLYKHNTGYIYVQLSFHLSLNISITTCSKDILFLFFDHCYIHNISIWKTKVSRGWSEAGDDTWQEVRSFFLVCACFLLFLFYIHFVICFCCICENRRYMYVTVEWMNPCILIFCPISHLSKRLKLSFIYTSHEQLKTDIVCDKLLAFKQV